MTAATSTRPPTQGVAAPVVAVLNTFLAQVKDQYPDNATVAAINPLDEDQFGWSVIDYVDLHFLAGQLLAAMPKPRPGSG
jgi:hypothetical protein